jgi:tetratricopeptide (TPR) repeat protein
VPLEAYTRLRDLEDAFKGHDAMIKLAEAYARLGGSRDVQARAETLLETVMREDSSRMEPYLILLRIAAERSDLEAEQKLLDAWARLDVFDASMVSQLVRFYEQQGRHDRIQEVIALASRTGPDDMEVLYLRAVYETSSDYGELSKQDEALQTWRRIVTESDDAEHLSAGFASYVALLRQLAILPHEVGVTEREMVAKPDDWRVVRRLFVLYVACGRLEDALQLGASVEPFMDAGRALEELALTVVDEDRVDDGVFLLDRLTRKMPTRSWVYGLQAADLLARNQRKPAALRRLEVALESHPSSGDAYAQAAEVYLRLSELVKASAAADEAITLAPKQAKYRLLQAQILRDRWREEYEEELSNAAFDALFEGLCVATTNAEAGDLLSTLQSLVDETGAEGAVIAARAEAMADHTSQRLVADLIRRFATDLRNRGY